MPENEKNIRAFTKDEANKYTDHTRDDKGKWKQDAGEIIQTLSSGSEVVGYFSKITERKRGLTLQKIQSALSATVRKMDSDEKIIYTTTIFVEDIGQAGWWILFSYSPFSGSKAGSKK